MSFDLYTFLTVYFFLSKWSPRYFTSVFIGIGSLFIGTWEQTLGFVVNVIIIFNTVWFFNGLAKFLECLVVVGAFQMLCRGLYLKTLVLYYTQIKVVFVVGTSAVKRRYRYDSAMLLFIFSQIIYSSFTSILKIVNGVYLFISQDPFPDELP